MTSQKLETVGVWEIGREKVVDTHYMSTQDVLKVCCTIDEVADRVTCLLHGKQIHGGKKRQNVDEDFGWEIEKGVHRAVVAIYLTIIDFLIGLV